MRNPLLGFGLVSAVVCASCGGSTDSGGAGTRPESSSGSSSAGSSTAPVAAGYEVHEWALVDVGADGATELAGGPGHPPQPMSVRKPVIYVHLAEGVDELAFDLDARMTSGTILEHWPIGALDGGHVHWEVVARRAHCGTVFEAQARRDTPADGVSELPDLPLYDAEDAACLTLETGTAGLLFYRGTMVSPTLPYAITRGAEFRVTVTATGDTTGAPGEILRVSTGLTGPWPIGHVVISRAAVPARGATATLALGTVAVDPAAEGAALAEAMTSIGMSDPEAAAFVRAWSEGLFGAAPAASRRGPRDAVAVPGPPQDSILYWLPPAAIDSIATLAMEPAPRAVRRAFLVRVTLAGTDTASLGAPGSLHVSRTR